MNVRASMGLATFPHDAKTQHDVIRQADVCGEKQHTGQYSQIGRDSGSIAPNYDHAKRTGEGFTFYKSFTNA
jgi:hypothetical protein